MPQFLIETKKLVHEVLHILLVVLRDNCGDSLEISEDLANLFVNRLVEPQPSSKVCCQVVTDPCLKLFVIIDYASNNTARLSCHSPAETLEMNIRKDCISERRVTNSLHYSKLDDIVQSIVL